MELPMFLVLAAWFATITCSPLASEIGRPMIHALSGPIIAGAAQRRPEKDAPGTENEAGHTAPEPPENSPPDVFPDAPIPRLEPHVDILRGVSQKPSTPPPEGPLQPPRDPGCTVSTAQTAQNPDPAGGDIEGAYHSTETAFAQVDCRGCVDIAARREVSSCATKRTDASTIVPDEHGSKRSTARSPTPAAAAPTRPTAALPTTSRPRPGGWSPSVVMGVAVRQACQTTHIVQPQRTAGATATRFGRMVTQTVRLNCRGCQLRLSTALGGYGPINRFSKTVTVPVGTTTVYGCV